MNKSNNKTASKAGKKSSKNKKKFNWLPIVIILACFLFGFGIGFAIKTTVSKIKAKNLDVAFYKLPDEYKSEIEAYVSKNYSGKIKIVDISQEEYEPKKIARKYDLFFSLNGSAVTKLDKYAIPIPEDMTVGMPLSLKRKAKNYLPIILNHYELDYTRSFRDEAGLDFPPKNIIAFEEYLKKMRSYVFSPFFCAGGDDDTLLALVGALVEAFGGGASYDEMINNFMKRPSLAQTIDFQLSKSGNKKDEFTLRSILDLLRSWQSDGITHPNWFNGTMGDVQNFLEVNQIAVLFTSLSNHRSLNYNLISNMDVERMPVFSTDIKHGVVAPSLVAVKLTDTALFDDILYDLVSEEAQAAISAKFKLGPVDKLAKTYDRQSNDVRYLVAACNEGALPALGEAAFQTNDALRHKVAEEIRVYLKNGPTGMYAIK